MASSGSEAPVFTSPAVATRIAGAPPRPRSASSSAATSSRPLSSAGNVRTCRRPMPSIASAFIALGVHEAAAEHGHGRQARQALLLDVHALLQPPPPARGREPGEVRGRRATREGAAPAGGEAEQLLQPRDRDLLDPHRERRAHPVERDLVDRARPPVGGERGGRPAAHHEVEEPRPGRPRRAVGGGLDQLAHRRQRAVALERQRRPDRAARLGRRRPHRRRVELREVPGGLLGDEPERLVERVLVEERVGHGEILDPPRSTVLGAARGQPLPSSHGGRRRRARRRPRQSALRRSRRGAGSGAREPAAALLRRRDGDAVPRRRPGRAAPRARLRLGRRRRAGRGGRPRGRDAGRARAQRAGDPFGDGDGARAGGGLLPRDPGLRAAPRRRRPARRRRAAAAVAPPRRARPRGRRRHPARSGAIRPAGDARRARARRAAVPPHARRLPRLRRAGARRSSSARPARGGSTPARRSSPRARPPTRRSSSSAARSRSRASAATAGSGSRPSAPAACSASCRSSTAGRGRRPASRSSRRSCSSSTGTSSATGSTAARRAGSRCCRR